MTMKKFLVLYLSSVPASEQMAKSTPEQAKAGMEAWMAWGKKAAGAIVDFGAPLGGPMKVTSTSSAATDSKVTGFSILQAESAKALGEVLTNHPHFKAPGGSLEVFEFLPLPGSPA
jgi:hypothetical protein